MAISITKPDKYNKCIGCDCSDPDCISEYIFSSDEGTAKLGVVLCSNCVTNMYKESQKEDYNDKIPENN